MGLSPVRTTGIHSLLQTAVSITGSTANQRPRWEQNMLFIVIVNIAHTPIYWTNQTHTHRSFGFCLKTIKLKCNLGIVEGEWGLLLYFMLLDPAALIELCGSPDSLLCEIILDESLLCVEGFSYLLFKVCFSCLFCFNFGSLCFCFFLDLPLIIIHIIRQIVAKMITAMTAIKTIAQIFI